jgi:deoxycytidylate deaminase
MNSVIYPYLPEGKNISYVTSDNLYIQAAKEFAREYSTDRQHSTGAIVVKDGEVIGRGANQVPLKNPKLKELHKNGWCVRKVLKVKSGEKYWLCPGCSKSSDHAEQQAVRDAMKHQKGAKGADLYLWGHWWCCESCWTAMLNAGIDNVFLIEGSEILFDKNHLENVIGKQFDILSSK